MDISSETNDGDLKGTYSENYRFTIIVVNEIIDGQWDMQDAQIGLDNSVMFTVYPVATDIGLNVLSGGTRTYAFMGTLDTSGSLSGQVTEDEGNSQRNWTLSRSGGCPY